MEKIELIAKCDIKTDKIEIFKNIRYELIRVEQYHFVISEYGFRDEIYIPHAMYQYFKEV